MARWLKPTDRHEDALLGTATWTLRGAVLVTVTVLALTGSGPRAAGIVELLIGGAALAGWWVSGRLQGPWATPLLVGCLLCLAAVGGFAATSHHQTALIAFAIVGVVPAGAELEITALAAVLCAGVLAVEIGAVIYDNTDVGTVLGYPALLAALALVGRYRRTYRFQAQQARALLAESQRAQSEAERVAALTERSRIAREIHDVLAHSLGALGIQLQAAEAVLSERGDIDGALRALSTAKRLVDEGLTETRRAVHALRNDAPPLPQALAALVSDGTGELTVTGEPYALSPAAGVALLRVAQEAVTNVRKHAGGRPTTIALTYGGAGVELQIENELAAGRATEPSGGAGGYGLAGMRERLRLIGGEVTAGTVDDRWVVRASVAR